MATTSTAAAESSSTNSAAVKNEELIKTLPSGMSLEEMRERLLLVQYDGSETFWPAIRYDNYVHVLRCLESDQLHCKLKSEMFLKFIHKDKEAQGPMVQLLGCEDERGCVCLKPLDTEAKSHFPFWQGPFMEWLLYCDLQGFVGRSDRARKLLTEILEVDSPTASSNATTTTTNTTTTTTTTCSQDKEPTTQHGQQQQPNPAVTTAAPKSDDVVEDSCAVQKPATQDRARSEVAPAQQAPTETHAAVKSAASFEVPAVKIDPYDSWEQAWAKLGRMGWKKRTDNHGRYFYVKPGKMWAKGVLGEDYFDSLSDIQKWTRQAYGWNGGLLPVKQAKAAIRKAKTPKQKVSTPFLPRKHNPPNDSPNRVWGLDRKPSRTMAKSSVSENTKPRARASSSSSNKNRAKLANSQKYEAFYLFKYLWPLLTSMGWKHSKATLLHDWYFIRPGCSKDGVLGVDYFTDRNDVVRYCQEHDYHITYGSPASTSSELKGDQETSQPSEEETSQGDESVEDEMEPRRGNGVSAVSVDDGEIDVSVASSRKRKVKTPYSPSDASCSNSSRSTHASEYEINYTFVWPILRSEGWQCIAALNKLETWWWVLPGRCAKNGTQGVDYLTSEQEVVNYYKRRQGKNKPKVASSKTKAAAKMPTQMDATSRKRAKTTKRVQLKVDSTLDLVSCESPEIENRISKTAWWHSEQKPEFQLVWPILQKLDVRFQGGRYVVPFAPQKADTTAFEFGGGKFATDYDLKKFLCLRGIPDFDKNESKLTDDEKIAVYRWVSFANVPPFRSEKLENLELLSDDDAWHLLSKIGFSRADDGRFLHGILAFKNWEEMRCHVRSLESFDSVPGRKQGRHAKSVLRERENLVLRLWAASSEMPLPEFQVPAWAIDSLISHRASHATPRRSTKRTVDKEYQTVCDGTVHTEQHQQTGNKAQHADGHEVANEVLPTQDAPKRPSSQSVDQVSHHDSELLLTGVDEADGMTKSRNEVLACATTQNAGPANEVADSLDGAPNIQIAAFSTQDLEFVDHCQSLGVTLNPQVMFLTQDLEAGSQLHHQADDVSWCPETLGFEMNETVEGGGVPRVSLG